MCRLVVGNKNDDIWGVRAVSVGSVEYFFPRKSQSGCSICVTAEVWNISDGINEWWNVDEVGQIEIQRDIVTWKQFRSAINMFNA